MRDIIKQGPRAYRYVLLKGVHNLVPFVATIAAIAGQPVLAVLIILCQLGTGALTDLSFFSALKESNGGTQ